LIEYDAKVWFRHIAQFHKTDTFRILLPEMIIVGVATALLAYIEINYLKIADEKVFRDSTVVHSILGFILSLLLVFRTNTAYERWWEGRKLWGSLVNNTRNLAIKMNVLLPPADQRNREFFVNAIPDFAVALKEHLRDGVKLEELHEADLRETLTNCAHAPTLMVQEMYRRTKQLYTENQISGEEFLMFDKELKSFMDIMGACERIRNTPIPFSYNIFLKKFIFFYIITLPFAFIGFFGYWAVPVSIFVFYVLVSLEVIAEEIENPFGQDANDLPTDRLASMIRSNVQEIFAQQRGSNE
jgi:putative membrane protein